MPTYVYKFIETGETIEIQQSFDDDALTEAVHPDRGEPMAVKKVFLPVGVTFRGDGFYKTDSRKSNGKPSTPAGASSEGAASGPSESSGTSSTSTSTKAPTPSSTSTPTSTSGSSSD